MLFAFICVLPGVNLRYLNKRPGASRNRAADKKRIRRNVNLKHAKIFYRDAVAAHAASHAHSFCNPSSGASASADGTRASFFVLLSVASRTSVETVPFNNTLKTLSF